MDLRSYGIVGVERLAEGPWRLVEVEREISTTCGKPECACKIQGKFALVDIENALVSLFTEREAALVWLAGLTERARKELGS